MVDVKKPTKPPPTITEIKARGKPCVSTMSGQRGWGLRSGKYVHIAYEIQDVVTTESFDRVWNEVDV